MKNKIIYFLSIIVLAITTSCSDWLEINPKDRIIENDLFKDKEGFMVALNGVYIELNSPDLYGGKFFCVLDVLAQSFITPDEHRFKSFGNYSYQEQNVKSTFSGFWDKFYKEISNCNSIIEHCDKSRNMLGNKYYNIVKGEALALRAMLHFDVLRLWGPIYSTNKNMKCIPYMENSKLEIQELAEAVVIGEKIISDLKQAEELLEKYDPVIEEGPLAYDDEMGESNDFRYRTSRLNYFGVLALRARVEQWLGNNNNAIKYAKKVIDYSHGEEDSMFPFILDNENPNNEDRIYQSEILFGCYNIQRTNIFKNYYSNNLSDLHVMRLKDDQVTELYEVTDYRYRYQWQQLKNSQEETKLYFTKYKDPSDLSGTNSFRFSVPVLKIIEMYYIMAECSEDETTAIRYINLARNARDLADIPEASLLSESIEKEYQREFLGEGQLFFYYKRINKEQIKEANDPANMVEMTTEKYVLELPDSEINNRIN